MEKESNTFLVLTLTTASKWSDRRALVSADGPKGPSTGCKAKLSSFLLPLCFERWTSKGGNLKVPSKSGEEASLSPAAGRLSVEPFQSLEGAKQLLIATLLT